MAPHGKSVRFREIVREFPRRKHHLLDLRDGLAGRGLDDHAAVEVVAIAGILGGAAVGAGLHAQSNAHRKPQAASSYLTLANWWYARTRRITRQKLR